MSWRIEVAEKEGFYDAIGRSVKHDIRDLRINCRIKEVKTVQVYLLDGRIDEYSVKKICENLLIDPITQKYSYRGNVLDERPFKVVEVAYNAGVMDPVEDSASKAIGDLGISGVDTVKTAKKYLIKGNLSYSQIHSIAEKILYNKVIQHAVKGKSEIPPEPPPYHFTLKHIDILGANDRKLKKCLRMASYSCRWTRCAL